MCTIFGLLYTSKEYDMPFDLKDLKEHNSGLLDLLTQHLPDMLWVKDLNGNYLYTNKAICDGLLMAKDTQEPIGKGDVFFALREREAHSDKPNWHTFGELCFNSDQVVIDTDKAMKFEEYGNVKGELLYLEVYKAPFYDKDGKTLGTVGTGRDITELKKIQLDLQKSLKILNEQQDKLAFQASHDSLTDLPNRVLFLDRLENSMKVAKRHDKHIAVLFLDLDHFKEINDSLGHEIGDKVLIEVARRMQKQMRHSDTLSRFGGDEFAIILNDLEEVDDINYIVEKGMRSFKKPFVIGNNTLHISLSVGISIYPNDGDSPQQLLKNSDAAMYKAKSNGRNTYSYYDEVMTKKAYERIYLETELRKAFKRDELIVYYQPQMDAATDCLIGMEALVRWKHPEMGFVYPDKFIPLAESNGMIVELDRIVMQQAIQDFKKWHEAGLTPSKLSLNLAMKQIEESDFLEFFKKLMSREKCSFEYIEFEVTETQVMSNPIESIEALRKISDLGVSIAVDDFGTGYSSLAYLKRLPINKLKIDKSFVDNLPEDMEDSAITRTIISLCKSLNLNVIAEGVETIYQKDFLIENGCQNIQGYFYSRPIPADEMEEFLKEHSKG